jgi:hypothetical protein
MPNRLPKKSFKYIAGSYLATITINSSPPAQSLGFPRFRLDNATKGFCVIARVDLHTPSNSFIKLHSHMLPFQ